MANAKFEIYRGRDEDTEQCWRWRLLDTNGKNIAISEEAFLKDNVHDSIEKMKSRVTSATPIVPLNGESDDGGIYRFAYWESENDSQWYWRLKAAGNSETMAIGGEGFTSKQSVERSIENVRDEIPLAEIGYEDSDD